MITCNSYLETALQDIYSFVGTIVLVLVIGFMAGFVVSSTRGDRHG